MVDSQNQFDVLWRRDIRVWEIMLTEVINQIAVGL
jgi:hypothetical protein